jgi:hypothetical protein
MKRCTKCGTEKPLDQFGRRADTRSGLRSYCLACQSLSAKLRYAAGDIKASRADRRSYYYANRESFIRDGREARAADPELFRERARRHREKVRAAVFDHYGWRCACCGASDRLTIDHVNGDGASHRRELFGSSRTSGTMFYRWLTEQGFPDGYQALCVRCNSSKSNGERCRLAHLARLADYERASPRDYMHDSLSYQHADCFPRCQPVYPVFLA